MSVTAIAFPDDTADRRHREQSIRMLRTDFGEFLPFLTDQTTTDVVFNDDGQVWALCGNPRAWVRLGEISARRADSLAQLSAASAGKKCDEENPFCGAMVPIGEGGAIRAQLTWKTVSPNVRSAATFRRNIVGETTLEDLVRRGMMTADQARTMRYILVDLRKNFLISGEPGGGKSTVLSAGLGELKGDKRRMLVLEDEAELLPRSGNVRRMLATYSGGRLITWHDLMVAMKREKPERLVVGELREGMVAVEMLKILNSGVAGSGTTIHSDSAELAYVKFRELHCEVAPVSDYRIAETFPYVVHVSELKVQKVCQVDGVKDGAYNLSIFSAP